MLCESLLLLLVGKGVIAKEEAVEAIDVVLDVKREVAGVQEGVVVSLASIGLLQSLARSITASAMPEHSDPS